MATQEQKQALTALYVGYYDRAPDPDGLQFWIDQIDNGREFSTIAADFAAAPEALAKYPYLSTPDVSTPSTFITSIYLNLFGRTPDQAGLDFWTGVLNDGSVSVAEMIEEIIMGAVNDEDAGTFDKTVLDNKIEVGLDFAESTADVSGFEFDADAKMAAEAAVNGVTEDPATVEAAKAATDAYLAGETNQGDTLTLTTSTDTLVGTDGNDTFNAPIEGGFFGGITLNSLDDLDGGAGVDTLRVENGQSVTGTFTSIENLTLRGPGAVNQGNDLDVSSFSGKIELEQSADTAVTLTSVSGQSIVADRVANGTVIDTNSTATATSLTLESEAAAGNVTFNADGATLTDISLTVDGTKAGSSVIIDNDDGGTLIAAANANKVKNVSIEATGDSTVDVDSSALETLTITGAGKTTYNGDAASKSVDASASTGGVVINTALNTAATFTGSEAADTITVGATTKALTMGDGDDTVNVTVDALGANGSIDGGEGTDVLSMSAANAAAASLNGDFEASVSNFEVLGLGEVATGATATVDLDNLDDISMVKTAGTAAANVANAAVKEVQTISVGGAADANGGILTVGGVDVAIADAATDVQVAAAIAGQQAALMAANADIESVAVNPNDNTEVLVTYKDTAGDVADISVAQNASGVTVGAVSEDTAGVASSQEVQTITVGNAAAQSGSFTVGGVTVDVLVGDSTAAVAGKIQAALDANKPAGVATVTNPAAPGNTVEVTYTVAAGDTANLAIAGADAIFGAGNEPTIAESTQGGQGGTAEVQTFTVTGADADGGEIVVGGVKIDVAGGATADQVGATIVANQAAIKAANPDIDTIGYNTTGSVVTVTYKDTAGNVADIEAVSNDLVGVVPTVAETTTGELFAGTPGGSLILNGMADAGTVELTDNNEGSTTVVMDDASGSDDSLKLKLNGTANLYAGMVIVADVETINIETTNSDEDNLPQFASYLDLQAADTETVTVSGNHGVIFDGLSSVTLFDASGVQASESSAGADDAGTVGRVYVWSGATDADVTILTGNGDDIVDATFVGTGTTDDVAATVTTGAGDDTVYGSKGGDTIDLGEGDDVVYSSKAADTITLGEGNDVYDLNSAGHSTIAVRDVITDFSANTEGNATANLGANGVAADDLTGDLIDLQAFGAATLDVEVFANAADASTYLGNNDFDSEMNIALDSSTGYLYIDSDDDGLADSVIELQGVTTIDEAAFLI